MPRYHYVKTLWFSYPRLTVKPTAPKDRIETAAAAVGDDVSSQATGHVTYHPEEVQLLFSHFLEKVLHHSHVKREERSMTFGK